MAQTVHAEDTAAEQGQTPEKKSGTVTLEKKNDGTYVFGNEYLKRTFSLSADKVLSTKEIQTIVPELRLCSHRRRAVKSL